MEGRCLCLKRGCRNVVAEVIRTSGLNVNSTMLPVVLLRGKKRDEN
jgi:hypothetical protein